MAKKKVVRKQSPTKKVANKKSAAKKKPASPKKSSTKKKTAATKKTAAKRVAKKPAPKKTAAKRKTATKSTRAKAAAKENKTATPVENRSIGIGRDAIGNAIISGDGNVVVIQTNTPELAAPESNSDSPAGPNPYKGLLAFCEEDADRFFGREEIVQSLWQQFRNLVDEPSSDVPRILPILGPSGSGKSSVARAGLIPEFARRPIPGRDKSRVAVLTPGTNPLEALATVLARIATNDRVPVAKAREFLIELHEPNNDGEFDGLRRIADALPDIQTRSLIILVDQFEELYTLCDDEEERTAFIENLLHAAADRTDNVAAIMTLRTDFLDETQNHAKLNSLVARQGVIIPAMNENELRKAITEPARLAGHPLDSATVDLLIHETEGREGALPLLQFALTRIWDGLAAGVEPAETLKSIGGVGGALAKEAERIYKSLDESDKAIARRVFLGLVQLGEGTRDTRRRAIVASFVALGENQDQVEEVVRRFSGAGSRLITLSAEPDGTEVAEVTHESLFEHWRTLDEWLEDSRDDLRFQRRLDQAARHWDGEKRAPGLLWRPPDLDYLTQFHERHGRDISSTQLDFFVASCQAEDQRLEEKEQQQQQLRRRMIAAILAAIAASVMALVATGLWRNAIAMKREADQNAEHVQASFTALLDTASVDEMRDSPGASAARNALLDKAKQIAADRTSRNPTEPKAKFEFAQVCFEEGEIRRRLGKDASDFDAARSAFLRGKELLKNLTSKNMSDKTVTYHRLLAEIDYALALTISESGSFDDWDSAESIFKEAILRFQKLVEFRRPSSDAIYLGRAQSSLANLYDTQGNRRQAEKYFLAAIESLEASQDVEATHEEERQWELGSAYNNYAIWLSKNDNPELAVEKLGQARLLMQPLAGDNQVKQHQLAKVINNRADFANYDKFDADSFDALSTELKTAIETLDSLAKPAISVQADLGNIYNSLGKVLQLQSASTLDADKKDELLDAAGVAFDHAIQQFRQIKDLPEGELKDQFVTALKNGRSLAMTMNRHRKVVEYVTLEAAIFPNFHISAAAAIGQAISTSMQDPLLSDEARKNLKADYASKAIAELRMAIDHGFNDADGLEQACKEGGPFFHLVDDEEFERLRKRLKAD